MRCQRRFGGRLAVLLATLAVPLGLVGCGGGSLLGYSHEAQYAEDVRTVAVPIFENKTFYREIGFDLTEALIKRIEQRTPYKVTDADGADTIINGTIVAVDERLLSRDFETGVTQEGQAEVRARFEWKDLRSGDIRTKRSRIEGTGEYIPTRGVGEPFEVARMQAVEELADRIVETMRADW